MNSNMINPANYYNPFAKYNYVSKTRGVYIPKEAEPLLGTEYFNAEKSANIFSDNYDAETDVMQNLNMQSSLDSQNNILSSIGKLFGFSKNKESYN